jgi:hypothetical protein
MKKKIILSLVVAAFALSTVGCGSGGGSTKKIDDNKSKDDGKKKGGDDTNSNLDIVENGDLKIVRNIQSKEVEISYKHTSDEKILQFFIDVDNNENTGSTEVKGAEYKVVNHRTIQPQQKIYEVNSTDTTKWVTSNKNSGVTYKSDGIILTSDIVPTQYFSVKAEAYEINASNDDWIYKKGTGNLAFNMVLANSGDPKTIPGDHGLSIKIDNNNTDISIQLLGVGYDSNSKLYIDSDDSNQTGYSGIGLWKDFGPDYMIGNGTISNYTASGWSESSSYKQVTKKSVIKFNIKRSDLGNPTDKIRVGVALHTDSNLTAEKISGSIPKVNGIYNQAQTLAAEYILK